MTETSDLQVDLTRRRLPTASYGINRADLIRYAGASGDFNPIHWSDRIARSAGLPDVIAHGMLLMALAGRAVGDWAEPGEELESLDTRFTRPAVVPDDADGVLICIDGTVTEALPDGGYRIVATIRTTVEGTVVARCGAVIRTRER